MQTIYELPFFVDVRFRYFPDTDEMAIGINFWEVCCFFVVSTSAHIDCHKLTHYYRLAAMPMAMAIRRAHRRR
jgi:hypothetical protein